MQKRAIRKWDRQKAAIRAPEDASKDVAAIVMFDKRIDRVAFHAQRGVVAPSPLNPAVEPVL